MKNIIQLENITKSYDANKVVDNLSFNVKKGHILGFLGPNGAGKSTTIGMISTLINQDSGRILYKGEDVDSCRQKFKSEIGVVPQDLAIYEDLTAYQNVKFFASLYGIPKKNINNVCEQALEFVGLETVKNKKAKTYSGGMKRRLNIACSLVNAPKLIILDEPTVGIDPQSRNYILDSIRKLQSKGVSVIYTTHYMEEIEAIADDVVIMDHGRVLVNDTLENVHNQFLTHSTITLKLDDSMNDNQVSELHMTCGVKDIEMEKNTYKFCVDYTDNKDIITDIMKVCDKWNKKIISVNTNHMDLEDIFLKLTGSKLRD